MKMMKAIGLAAIILFGLVSNMHSVAAVLVISSEKEVLDISFDKTRHFALQDAVLGYEQFYGFTELPKYQPLEVHRSDDPAFEYMAYTPYYRVYFKGNVVRMQVGDAWIKIELIEIGARNITSVVDQETLDTITAEVSQNLISVSEIFESVDLSYTVDTSLLTEALTLKEANQLHSVGQKISWEGMNPEFTEDGSIVFFNENEKEILKILPPSMRDAEGTTCTDLHYGLIETETGYELHKIIDEKGQEWLEEAVYPVTIDPTMEIIEDLWTESGLKSGGQFVSGSGSYKSGGHLYKTGTNQYVNPVNGHQLTLSANDLAIPGRGLDLVISRVYETPAVFYGVNPYDYEAPPVNVGKGWQLDFPYIGDKYLHLWSGTIYKIEWVNNTFENHEGSHFILVENGDSTYTLTTASGTVYEFSTTGELTHIKDLDENTVTFSYTEGELNCITDTIGRTVSLTYSNGKLQKITYNGAEFEYSYDANGCLVWVEDFLNRRTSYYYNSGYNVWLLSKVVYPTGGYTTYTYNRFSDSSYHKYYVANERVYETQQVRHFAYSYTGSFQGITSSTITVKNQSDITQGSYYCIVSDGLVTERQVKNASGSVIKKYTYTYNSKNQVTEEHMYNDGFTLSYTNYYSYDNWGNIVYAKNAEGHEVFFSYANTSTSGFFVDNTGAVIQKFTNAFSVTVPSSVHTVLLGAAEKQDSTFVREVYMTYDSEAHPTQSTNSFGNATTWLTYSGTFNEKTGSTSFPIDLTGHTVAGNGVLKITGMQSDDTYQENHSTNCGCSPLNCSWLQGNWSGKYFDAKWMRCIGLDCSDGWVSAGPFTHYPGTIGYQSYSTNPLLGQGGLYSSLTATTNWKAYPVQVQYKLDSDNWTQITSNLKNTTAKKSASVTGGSHTLYFSESSSQNTKFSWTLYVPVDNSPDTYTTNIQYDTYGNVTLVTDPESNTVTFTYSSSYSYAYLTETSIAVGTDTITTKSTYDYYRGWVTSVQQPKGVDAGSGYDYLYTYDLSGRASKIEFPLLSGQSQRSYSEIVYDDTNRTVTIIDQFGHYIVEQYDKLGRLTSTKWYTGTYGSGTLYATMTYTYCYNDRISTVTDPGNDQTTNAFDFLGRYTQVSFPDSSSVSFSYDDTSNKTTFTNGRGYDTIYWFDWLSRLTKVEEEYATDAFTVTTYQYNEIGQLTSFTDAENHTTTYSYSSLFGLTKSTFPDSEYEEYEYDDVGNIVSFTDANNNEIAYTYDSLSRLTQIQYEDLSTVSFTYDMNSNRTKMEDNVLGTGDDVEYTYDYWNRLLTETRCISTDTYTVSYEYDVANRLTKLTYPDNMQILYSYDDLSRITEIKRYVNGVNDEVLLVDVQYDVESLLTQFDYGNNLRATFFYDSRDRPLTIDVKDGETGYLDLDYSHDNSNNITQLVNGWRDTSSTWHSETESYSYDGLDRLTSASCTSWSHTYSYDKVGNRTAIDSVTYTINAVNEVTALSDGTSFTYDSNGNRTQKTKGSDTWAYAYDYANRLIEVEKNSSSIGEYVYDGDGKRIQITEDGETTTYIYSGLSVLYEENSTGTAAYIYGPTGKLAKRTTINEETNTFFYHSDHLGSTRLVTDESKNIVTAATYGPFGESSIEEGLESYLYNGKEKDETGLYYYGARYYDPETGRFITRDLLAGKKTNPQSLNRYTYCLNNPVKLIDPAGLTYSMYDVETGESMRVAEFGKKGRIFYNSEGEIIYNEIAIQDAIDAGDWVGAVLIVLEGLQNMEGIDFEIIDSWTVELDGVQQWGVIVLKMGDDIINIHVYGPEMTIMTKWIHPKFASALGSTLPTAEGVNEQTVLIFFEDPCMDAATLFHVVAHELQHAIHLVEGDYHRWVKDWNKPAADAYSDYLAYKWNVEHLYITGPILVDVFSKMQEYLEKWGRYKNM